MQVRHTTPNLRITLTYICTPPQHITQGKLGSMYLHDSLLFTIYSEMNTHSYGVPNVAKLGLFRCIDIFITFTKSGSRFINIGSTSAYHPNLLNRTSNEHSLHSYMPSLFSINFLCPFFLCFLNGNSWVLLSCYLPYRHHLVHI